MEDTFSWTDKARRTVRDYLRIGFSHHALLIGGGIFVVLATLLSALFLPGYEVTSKLLLERDRQDPVVTSVPDQNSTSQYGSSNPSEAELNAEVDMLTGRDLLLKVVKDCKLADEVWTFFPFTVPMPIHPPPPGSDPRAALAAKHLAKKLDIETATGATVTNTIDISYKNSQPDEAYCVVNSLNKRFLELHLAVHRPGGELGFFADEAEAYRQSLTHTEDLLAKFPHDHRTVSGLLEKEIALQRLNEFKAALQQTRAKIAKSAERARYLQARNAATPTRIVTQAKTGDNPQLQQNLRSTLLTLELKRDDLLTKFQPDYRPVQEVEKQIAETHAAIAGSEKTAVKEETTDLDPIHEWMRSELAKAQADLKDLQAEADADARIVAQYQSEATRLNATGLLQQDLLREAKSEEDSYLLYRRKREEARIADALDRNRFANVIVAEQPVLPTIPDHNPLLYAMAGFLASTVFSLGLIVTAEYVKPSFHTPEELESILSVPVLAAVPYTYKGNGNVNGHNGRNGRNGNGRHNSAREDGNSSTTSVLDIDT